MSYKKPSYKKTVFDITISMGLVGLLVVLLAVFIGQTRKPNEIEIRAVDLSAIARGAESRTELSIWVPRELAEGWVATSGRLEQIQNLPSWRFGLVTPSREFIGVKVSENAPERMLQVSGYEITKSEIISLDSRLITQWEDEIKNERGYFFTVGEENILIYGSANFEEQLILLKSLEKLGPS